MVGIIIAGGEGSRLGELTSYMPKAMACVNGAPLIGHIIGDLVNEFGIDELTVLLGKNPLPIMAYIEHIRHKKSEQPYTNYIYEPRSISAVHALKSIRVKPHETYVIMYCDTIIDEKSVKIVADCMKNQEFSAITTKFVPDVSTYGTVETDSDGIVYFREKERTGPGTALVGLMMFSSSALKYGLSNVPDSATVPELLDVIYQKHNLRIFEIIGEFADAGTPCGIKKAESIRGTQL